LNFVLYLAIHNREIAHRDIKPTNILLEKRQDLPQNGLNLIFKIPHLEFSLIFSPLLESKRVPGDWSSFPYNIKIGIIKRNKRANNKNKDEIDNN